jgi:hypothetical protein
MNRREIQIAQFLGRIVGDAADLSLDVERAGAGELLQNLDRLARAAGDVFLAWTGQSVLDLPALNLETLEPRERIV